MERGAQRTIREAFNLLKVIAVLEDKNPGIMDLVNASKLNHKTVQKYLGVFEELGLIEIEPTERKNIVRLTDAGKCLVRCLP